MRHILRLTVNGEPREMLVLAHQSLLDFLREDLDLTGSKHGCDVGDCGACTVLVDGQPRLACITLALDMEGREVVTVEGLPRGGELHPVQRAFDTCVAAQCGYCTPGFMITCSALLRDNPDPTEQEIREALSGNICRCTGYTKIIDAVRLAAAEMGRGDGEGTSQGGEEETRG